MDDVNAHPRHAEGQGGDTSETPPLPWHGDLRLAIIFLTRLPIPLRRALDDGAHSRAMAWFALVGALVGFIGGGAYTLAALAGLPAWPCALLALTATVLVTGALHEDGLADMADGIGGGRDRAAKLEIMRDSRLGSYGGVAIMLSLALRASTLAALGADPFAVAPAMAAAAAVSRAFIPVVAWRLPSARRDGLAVMAGRPPGRNVVSCLMMGMAVAVLLLGAKALGAALIAAAAVVLVAWVAWRHLGGYTGDVLGSVQQVAETVFLLALIRHL